ncbi:MAG: TonB-dependent receptor [Desulfobacterales bacterium]|nr:TonB-dependent receptor [Desulfobacterales bacterium]
MKKFRMITALLAIVILAIPRLGLAEEADKEKAEKKEEKVLKVGEIQVTAPREKEGIVVAPSATTINVEEYKMPGIPQNITDILKDRVIIDFRGQSDLVPGNDNIYMRGFHTKRFVTAIDGLTIEKGGGYGNWDVDYATLPLGQIESIEIMPGPHSVLYPGKAIGGVINLITKTPEKYPTLKPDFKVATSYRSYNTQTHNVNVDGGVGSFIYGFGFQNYHTDGYLRHNETDIDTFSGRLGYILPSDGYISLSASYTDQDREQVVKNDPSKSDYDSSYPETLTVRSELWQKPTQDKEAYCYRLNWKQPTPIGLWSIGAYYDEQSYQRAYWQYKDKKDKTKGIEYATSWVTEWDQWGGRIQDEIRFSENHISTVGFDIVELTSYQDKSKMVDRKAGYIQHKWTSIPRLKLTAGLRYEDINIWGNNWSSTKGYMIKTVGKRYKRHWNQLVPKSFLTYGLDDLSEVLRDTSLSVGVSKIWHAPQSVRDFQQYGYPSGYYLEPEHGIAYDFVLMRRLWKDINLKANYAFYEIKDYIAHNRTYAKHIPSGSNPVPPGLEYSDAKINLEKVHRHGVEVELNGHILDNLSFYASYAYQKLVSKGSEPAGKTELADRPKHRVNAGLRYNLFENTLLMLDYKYQSKQVSYTSEEVAEDEWVFYRVPMDAYDLFDFAVEQRLFDEWSFVKDGVLKFYVNNLLDEEYENTRGYPMTDRTYGVALSFGF